MSMKKLFVKADYLKILSLFVALAFLLCGCTLAPLETLSGTAVGTENVTTEEFPDGIVHFVKDGAPAVRLVTSVMNGELEETAKDRVIKFADYLESETGLKFEKVRDTRKIDESEKDMTEIIFGITTREESIAAYNTLTYDECSLTVVGNKILLCAYTEDNLIKVYNAFMNRVRKAKRETGEVCFKIEDVFVNRVKDASGALPLYTDGKCAGVFDSGEKSRLLLIRNTSEEEFTKYLDVLTENGFMSNPTDIIRIAEDEWLEKKAQSLCQGIVNYYLEIAETYSE